MTFPLYPQPANLITDNSALVKVVEELRGRLPAWCHPRDSDIERADHVPLCSTDVDHSYGLDSNEN
eukprot:1286289-Pyramimonas_sp.AAC.1